MVHTHREKAAGLVLALTLVLSPAAAYAANDGDSAGLIASQLVTASESAGNQAAESAAMATENDAQASDEAEKQLQAEKEQREQAQAELKKQLDEQAAEAERAEQETTDKILAYNKADIRAIGTQEKTGHTICCPSFSCAYGDAVIDGTVHDHSYYTCSCCTWNDWGGGGSWNRCVGTNDELLHEAYDQISAGKPTVIHVTGGSGEHWICLIGYKNANDPDHLTLDNFIALDPWDGAQITASDRWSLYGDGCEHISSR